MTKKTTKEPKALTPAKKTAKTVRKTPAAPAAKKAATKPAAPAPKPEVVTTISATFDVGFGNTLFVRGEGPGLSWDKGLPLSNVTADKWAIALPEGPQPVVFKLLINDEFWSGGEDYITAPGSSIDLLPTFPGW